MREHLLNLRLRRDELARQISDLARRIIYNALMRLKSSQRIRVHSPSLDTDPLTTRTTLKQSLSPSGTAKVSSVSVHMVQSESTTLLKLLTAFIWYSDALKE